MNIIYEAKTLEWVSVPRACNTNNHKIAESQSPNKLKDITEKEYLENILLFNKDKWTASFPDPPGSLSIPLSIKHCKILSNAALIGHLKSARPAIYKEELTEIDAYIKSCISAHESASANAVQKWFARLKRCSSKDGVYGAGPLMSSSEIVTSIVTSLRTYKSLEHCIEIGADETLYLTPWRDDWNERLEFRVFVCNKRITCISQYCWNKTVGFNTENLSIIAPRIVEYCDTEIINKFNQDSFVIDVIVVMQQSDTEVSTIMPSTIFSIELVEINSFGAESPAGSALFHWLNDYDIMYGLGDTPSIVVRYVSDSH